LIFITVFFYSYTAVKQIDFKKDEEGVDIMPNYCMNDLLVRGKAEDLHKFTNAFRGYPALFKGADEKRYKEKCQKPMECFNALHPVPKDVIERGFDSGLRIEPSDYLLIRIGEKEPPEELDGYHWCKFNWGSKADVYGEVQVSGLDLLEEAEPGEDGIEIAYAFDTEWVPPVEWLLKVAEDFPELEFELLYYEPGIAFAGQMKITEGDNILQDDYFE
jgi:hypothetical protein